MKKSEFDPKGRVCTKCKEFKDWSMFGKRDNGLNKHMSICKICKEVAQKDYRAKTPVMNNIIKDPIPFIEGEIWVDVVGASKYQISNFGRLKHKKRNACVKSCRPSSGNGLETISYLLDDGVRTGKTLGHLIAEHFVENQKNYKYIRYIDKDFLNNIASNIEYTECRVEHNKTTRVDETGRTCTKCNNFLTWDNFAYSKRGVRDKHNVCNNCCALYYLDNLDMNRKTSHLFYEKNRDLILSKGRKYREDNLDLCLARESRYRESHKEFLKFRLNNRVVRYSLFKDDFTIEEDARSTEDGYLEVRCTSCKKYFKPSYPMAASRRYALNSDDGSENRFYCSDDCKKSCSIFGTVLRPKGVKSKSKGRGYNKDFRDMVLDRDDYTCQICGSTLELNMHHIVPYKKNPMLEADLDNAITLCSKCHKMVHKEIPGCGYQELRGCL